MSGNDAGDRLDRVLGRLRHDAAEPLAPPRGGFADVERRRRRRRREAVARLAVVSVALVGAAALALWWWQGGPASSAPPGGGAPALAVHPPAGPPSAPPGTLDERPVVYAAEEGARLRQLDERTFALDAGTVWFSVEPGRGGLEVRTPERTVVVLGTVFAVSVEPSGGTRVGVVSGRVRVVSRDGDPIELAAGEELAAREPAPRTLDPAWRARMTALFPERVARESGATRAARPSSPASPLPPVPPPLEAPEVEPTPAGPPEVVAVPAEAPGVEPPVGRPPAAADGGESAARVAAPERPRTWSERYAAAEALLRAGDAAAAATALEALVETAPSSSAAEVTLLDLARVCRQQLRDPARAQALYQRYLDRYPSGQLREDARLALCNLLGARGNGVAERECLQQYLLEFPGGSAAATVRARLGLAATAP
ncbi:MAG: FecR domain-containing protein [Deltaproteobacteria bacterium]|nr:FecR domain-containing protein [Deltaproteobacteria bacterium]